VTQGLAADSLAFAMLHAARAVESVTHGRNLDQALAALAAAADLLPAARGAVQDLAYGTLRDFGRGDFLLSRLLDRPLEAPAIRALLLIALRRLESHPSAAHTTVDQAVEAASTLHGGAFKGLVNAVLRNFLRRAESLFDAAEADAVAHGRHPKWWLETVRRELGTHAESVVAAGNLHPPMALRVNPRRCAPSDLLADLAAARIDARACGADIPHGILVERPVPVARLPGFADGRVSVQDAGAQHAAPWLDLASGQRVLDACAAPGGKAAHILELADVELTALELDASRATRIDANLARLGLAAQVRVADCRAVDDWWDGRPFERVLADVPCSASGVARRHPDIKWLRREADVARFAAQTRDILDTLWQVLAPGGKMLFVTCSVFSRENQQQVAAFCDRHADCIRIALSGGPLSGADSLTDYLLLPTALHDGFYFALFAKQI
jgi:16S rRNA (cytosine967-C5)-methyltransferase